MSTWKDDVVKALENLGGVAHISSIHKEVEKLRKGNLNNAVKATIQRELESFSSDSDIFETYLGRKKDLFYMAKGKGNGYWGLRKIKNRFYWVSQNRTFNIERQDGFLWAPYLDKRKKKVFHWESLKVLKDGDIIFSHYRGTIPCVSIVQGSPIENHPRPRLFSNALSWMAEGRRVNVKYIDINPILLTEKFKSEINRFKKKEYWMYNDKLKHNQLYLVPIPYGLAKFLLDTIEKDQNITISDLNNFDESSEVSIDDLKSKTRKKSNKSSGQGFGLSSAERKAVEQRAMEVVSKEMKKQGWKVEDVHKEKNRGYDFVFKKQEKLIYCEVKGTQNSDAKVILTKNEVIAAEKNYPNSALYIVSGIFLDRSKKPVKASLGKLSLKKYPWEIKKDINEKKLVTLSYQYTTK